MTTAGSTVTRYVYDDDDLLFEVNGSNALVREYVYLPGTDKPLSVRDWTGGTGKNHYYALELPGHVMGLFNDSLRVVNRYRYGPWGQMEGTPLEGIAQPLKFMAREQDASSGLYYVRNRWYDVEQGRFISEDPIGLAGGINPYAYAFNNPLIARDPFGKDPECNEAEHIKMYGTLCPIIANGKPVERKPEWMQDGKAPNPSTRGRNWPRGGCAGLPDCDLRSPTVAERRRVQREIKRIRPEDFCGEVRERAQEMVNRRLEVWDNRVYVPVIDGEYLMLGEAPWHYDGVKPGQGMRIWTGYLHAWTIAHEAIHGMKLGNHGYEHGTKTPLGRDLDSTAKDCVEGFTY